MGLIKKPFELKVQALIKVLIYGQPGIGKSTLGLSAPKPLYIDCDKGVHRINPKHQTDTVPVEKWEDMQELLTTDISDYDTLVIDTAGKMLGFASDYLGRMNPKNKQADGSLTQKGYGARKTLFIDFFNKVTALNKHIVFVAHDKEDKKGDTVFVRPDIGGSSGADLIRELDLVGYIEAIGNIRTISFEPTESHYGKNTCGLQPTINLPDINKVSNDLLTQIFGSYQKNVEGRQEMGKQYQDLINVISGKVEAIKDADTANEVYTWVTEFDGHIWDSKYLAAMQVSAKAKTLNLIPNKETKKFENAGKTGKVAA